MSARSPQPTEVGSARPDVGVRLPLLLTLALLAAFAPIATDLYLPGFPAIAAELATDASGVQLTLTTFLVGMAFGQLVMGPVSDRFGRRGPLVASAAVCVLAGAATALTPNLAVLVVARLVQGFTGAGGMVIGRAVIADLTSGRAAAKAFTLMMTVGGVAPVVAPLIGGLLAGPVGWRGMLWAATGLCVLMLVAVLAFVPETRPRAAATDPGTSYREGFRRVLAARGFWGPTGVFALAFAVMMAYIAASPFVYQNVLGLSEVQYGIAFGINAVGLIGMGTVVGRLVDRVAPERIIAAALGLQVTAAVAFVLLVVAGAPTWTYAVAIFLVVLSQGAIMGPTAALAMSSVREVAGTGSAVMGFCQFALGALVSPLVGLGGESSALVPAVVMALASLSAVTVLLLTRRAPSGLE